MEKTYFASEVVDQSDFVISKRAADMACVTNSSHLTSDKKGCLVAQLLNVLYPGTVLLDVM